MELTQTFEDKEVRQLLFGGEADLELAFAEIDTRLRKRFVGGARDRLPGLRPEDLADAWQETLRDLFKAVRAREFEPDRELGPWLWAIFIRRAFDSIRGRDRYLGMLERARGMLSGTTVGDVLGRMDEEERSHLLARVRQALDDLTDRQRTVIQAFVEHYPLTQDMNVLRERVSKVTGHDETRAAVMQALLRARQKVADVLKIRQL